MSTACTAATFEGSGCRGTITDGQCSEQDDHHPTPGMLPYDGPGAESADTGQAREPGIAERAAKLGAAVNQERADQLATGLMALADDMRSMAGQWPDNAAARNAYGVAEMRARNLIAADRETENHFRPEPSGDTVQVPDVAAVLDRLNVAELAGDEEQEFNDGQRWMLQKIRRALLGTTREEKR